jgi:hypothetical protein
MLPPFEPQDGEADAPARLGEPALGGQAAVHAALDALEAAVNRRLDDDQRRDGLEEQLQAYGSDRSKLASELDRLRARSADLEAANREVSRRLDHAMGTIRAALELREH